jgi:hypothetical protein
MKARSRLLAVVATTATLTVCAVLAEGCGSIACTETDTCAEPGDGSDDGALFDTAAKDSSRDVTKPRDGRSSDSPAADSNDNDAPSSMDDGSENDSSDEAEPDSSEEAASDAKTDAPMDASIDAPRDAPADTAADVKTDSCASNPENCTNGIDDNCDGKIDCADPQCMSEGFTCVPPWAASGWTGPAVLYDAFQSGGPAPSPLPCASAGAYAEALPNTGSTELGNYDPTAVNPTCGCGCGSSVQGVTCPEPTVSASTNSCPGGGTVVAATASPTCTHLTGNDAQSVTVTLGTASGGSCPTNETGLPVPAWNKQTGWEGTGNACWTGRAASSYFSGAHGGCTGTNVCVEPRPGAFSGGAACVFLDGKASCPAGYANEHDYFTGANDTRGCSYSCTCTATGVACTADVTVSSATSGTCSGTQTMTNLPSGCTNVSNYSPVYIEATVASVGSCTFAAGALTGGAAATGSVTPTGQVTVCCN